MLPPATRRRHFFREVYGEPLVGGTASSLDALIEGEVRERCDLAWRADDPDKFLEAANWLHRNDGLWGSHARRLCWKLNDIGGYAQVLSILADPRYAKTETPNHWRTLAVALAGAGRLIPASEALERADQLRGAADPSDCIFAEALRLAREQGCRPDLISAWAEMARLVEAWLVLGSVQGAADALADAFGRPLPMSEDDLVEALHLAQDILRRAEPEVAEAFLVRMRPHFRRVGASHPGVQLCIALAHEREGRGEAAAALLGPLAQHRKGAEIKGAEFARLELARTVGRLVMHEAPPRFAPAGRRKIIDVFPINDELLMLKVKLEEMHSWVDHFVIVEAASTFTGRPKPLHFERAKSQFSEFSDKIVHVVVDSFPPWASTAWAREFYQRDCGLRGLADLCGEDDIVLITDVDEIVDRKIEGRLDIPFASLAMRSYGYFFNLERLEARQSRWGAAVRAGFLRKVGPSYLRLGLPHYAKAFNLEDAGWHFSTVRDPDGLTSKFDSYSNETWSGETRDFFDRLISRIRREGGLEGFERRDIDDSFPAYIRDNAETLRSLIL